MLQELHIRNFALIDRVDLQFGTSLNLLTGETGAGKSIVIDALGLVLGERASSDVIRTGADRALVEAVFDLSNVTDKTRQMVAQSGIDDVDGDGLLYVAREISRSGKSQCRVNGRLFPVAALRDICELLVDVHGQHEHQSLLVVDKHIDILDEWLGAVIADERAAVEHHFAEVSKLKDELEEIRRDGRERARNLDLYRFQQDEISAAALQAGEEEELGVEKIRLANAERLANASGSAHSLLAESVVDGLARAAADIERLVAMDDTLAPVAEQLSQAHMLADEVRTSLRRYREEIEFNPVRIEEIEDRLNLLHTLKRKYGDTIEEVISYGEALSEKLDALENQEVIEAKTLRDIEKEEGLYSVHAARLSEIRREGGLRFAALILDQLTDLGMAATRFEVNIEPSSPGHRGIDRIEFLLSPNPGEPLRPLARIASGGETSRIMLAIKTVLAVAAFIPTLIFDEIDVGVGGRTAMIIGDKLAALSQSAQVLCITHLPQIASRPASAHFYIEKTAFDDKTLVTVHNLDDEQRVDEITRMLGGIPEQQTVVEHARQMLNEGKKT